MDKNTKCTSVKKKLVYSKLLVMVMINILIVGLLYVHIIESVRKSRIGMEEQDRSNKFDAIWGQIELLQVEANANAKKVSANIENDIRSQMDLDALKETMDNGESSEELYRIIRSNIEGNSLNGVRNNRNNIIVANTDGIYEDLNIGRATSTETEFRDWESEISRTYNQDLQKDAINKLLEHSAEIIAVETSNYVKPMKDVTIESVMVDHNKPKEKYEHKKITEFTYDTLKEVYMTEGLNGLKNYQIWCPSYITDTGDIFGQHDIVEGKQQRTYKFIVIQEFNIYDQLKLSEKFYSYIESAPNYMIEMRYRDIIANLCLTGLCYTVTAVFVFFGMAKRYNDYLSEPKDENDE